MNITLPIGNFSSTSSFISDMSMPRRLSWNRYMYLLSFFTSYVYIFFIWFNVFHFISIFFTFRILEVENDLKEFTVLENATFIPISAKIGTNLNILKEKLISIVIDHKKRENEKNIINFLPEQVVKYATQHFNNKYFVRARLYNLIRFLPFRIWILLDNFLNWN